MMKRRLYTPGPTPVPERVLLRMAAPLIHHRTQEFRTIVARTNQGLQDLFRTSEPVLTLSCSGTGGMESTFVSLFSPGDTIISVNNGKFGERWVTMPRTFGLNVMEITVPWSEAPTPDLVTRALAASPDAKAVYLTHSETSTGTATDVRALARIIRDSSDALVCVDGISAIGAMECRFDEWGIDVCVTGSQKGLMLPPGLAFVALSRRAQSVLEKATLPSYYLNLRKALASWKTHDTPWTPAIALVTGLDEALAMIREEGIENVWKRHARIGERLRQGLQSLGIRLFSRAPSDSVTAAWLPDGIDWKEFQSVLRDTWGMTVAGGQGAFAGKIFRIGHLGYCDETDIAAFLDAAAHMVHHPSITNGNTR